MSLRSCGLLDDEIELQRLVERHGGMRAAAGRLRVAAHGVEAIADHADREAVPGMRHRRHDLPAVDRRVVGLDRAERGEQAPVALRAVGIRSRTIQVSAAGSYISTRSTLLLPPEMNAAPMRPPMA